MRPRRELTLGLERHAEPRHGRVRAVVRERAVLIAREAVCQEQLVEKPPQLPEGRYSAQNFSSLARIPGATRSAKAKSPSRSGVSK